MLWKLHIAASILFCLLEESQEAQPTLKGSALCKEYQRVGGHIFYQHRHYCGAQHQPRFFPHPWIPTLTQ